MADSVELKRRREDEFPAEEVELEASPAPKRLREDFFYEILDDDIDADADAGDQYDIASVMKSLEEEIALPSVSPPPPPSAAPAEQPDLGYLFEASDDELGLPPTVLSSSDESGENAETAAAGNPEVAAGNPEVAADQGVGFGQIWAFDDEISGYDAFDLGIRPEDRPEVVDAGAGEDAVAFDGGLFDFGDVLCGSSDFAEFSWRSESLPAV